MNPTQQFIITIAVAPILSLVIVIAGYIVQNTNLNARVAEIKGDTRDLLNAHTGMLRAEMAKNQSELLGKFADLDQRLNHIEDRFRLRLQ
ncbi:hypothetical protein SBA4_7530002 [Candidatus Sulfopaludibacter sp. SbA4]|nr:hypothetical protein SBA4_7530002 [Candidatus Sulfopaludibacter sp. SbA4]